MENIREERSQGFYGHAMYLLTGPKVTLRLYKRVILPRIILQWLHGGTKWILPSARSNPEPLKRAAYVMVTRATRTAPVKEPQMFLDLPPLEMEPKAAARDGNDISIYLKYRYIAFYISIYRCTIGVYRYIFRYTQVVTNSHFFIFFLKKSDY